MAFIVSIQLCRHSIVTKIGARTFFVITHTHEIFALRFIYKQAMIMSCNEETIFFDRYTHIYGPIGIAVTIPT